MGRGTVAVDFDCVLHTYTVWDGDRPTGKPVPGARRGLQRLKAAGFDMVVFTARTDALAVMEWLAFYGLKDFFLRITNKKTPDMVAFFDDRGWHVEANDHTGLNRAVSLFLEHEAETGKIVNVVPEVAHTQRRLVA